MIATVLAGYVLFATFVIVFAVRSGRRARQGEEVMGASWKPPA